MILAVTSTNVLFAQSESSGSRGLLYSLIALGVLLAFWAVFSLVKNFLQMEAKRVGIDTEKDSMNLLPPLRNSSRSKAPAHIGSDTYVKLKKGFDIKLDGEATGSIQAANGVKRFSVSPYNFRGISPIPKVVVAAGDNVKAGEVLFFDKKNPDVKYVAPVSGEVLEVKRGAKRSISNVIILADKEQSYVQHDVPNLDASSREDLVSFLASSGAWSLFNQRPFDIIPDLNEVPRDIFVSTFDTAPLAPENEYVIAGNEAAFQKGIEVLSKLTSGKVHVGIDGSLVKPSAAYLDLKHGVKHYFSGKHPAGNVGVQIHHIAPIAPANDMVWTSTLQEVITLGNLFLTGTWNTGRVVALTGAELKSPKYVKTFAGANVGELIADNLNNDHVRFISGDVLSGESKGKDDFLNERDDQLTVVEEGDKYEAFGWLLPTSLRPSISKTFPNFLFPNFKFKANTNTHGEKRAYVVSGLYEEVLPMNIYPTQLMKSILTSDFETMEGLGITELSEEDIALCEFVCPSKNPMQETLRHGLDMMRAQL